MDAVKQVGPHTFAGGSLRCTRCRATFAAAELDAERVPTTAGLPYARYPRCLPEGVKPAKSGLIRRMPGLVVRAIRLGL